MNIKAPIEYKEEIRYKPFSNVDSNQQTINFFNNGSFSCSPNSKKELVGGINQEWNIIKIEDVSKNSVEQQDPQLDGEDMGVLAYELKNAKRTDFPIFLDPEEASFIDVGLHAKMRQYLSDSTIIKNLRYARFMERHPVPIDFRDISAEQFIRHMDYRIEIENASPHALAHEKKTIVMFLRAYGITDNVWSTVCKTPPVVINDDVEIVFPSKVHQFFTCEDYSNRKNYNQRIYENKLFQHIAFIGFMYGMRPPSEIVTLNLDDVIINNDGSGYIRIHEMKKRGKRRKIIPFNKKVLSSPAYKTPKNYINNWRWKVANDESDDALFLQPNGKRITKKYVRSHLSFTGKKIAGKQFKCYHMRHTYGTYLYNYTKNIKFVSNSLGHTKTSNTDKYVHISECMEHQLNGNLFNMALKPHNFGYVGAKPKNRFTFGQRQNRPQLKVIPPVGTSGLIRI